MDIYRLVKRLASSFWQYFLLVLFQSIKRYMQSIKHNFENLKGLLEEREQKKKRKIKKMKKINIMCFKNMISKF